MIDRWSLALRLAVALLPYLVALVPGRVSYRSLCSSWSSTVGVLLT